MKPAPFSYCRPESVDALLAVLDQHGDQAQILAGGQSLGPLLNLRLARPEIVVDINHLPASDHITVDDRGWLRVGATARQRVVERSANVHAGWPLLAEALGHVAHPTIRNRGTVVGSLAHADPAAELPSVAVALGASLHCVSSSGVRIVEAHDFFVSHMTTALQPQEYLAEVWFPPAVGVGAAWTEFAPRHGDFGLVGVAAVVSIAGNGHIRGVRLVYSGLSSTPLTIDGDEVHQAIGAQPDGEVFATLAEDVAAVIRPTGDDLASPRYKRRLVRHLTEEALSTASSRAV